MAPTHRLVNGTTAFVVTTAVGMPLTFAGVSSALAAASASLPDDAEKLLHVPQRFHRQNPTHYPAAQLIFFALLAVAGSIYAPQFAAWIVFACACLAFGCVTHSLADAMTVEKRGIKLAWPISRRGYHLLPWKMRIWVGSNSPSERLFVAVWCAFVLIYVYARFRHLIST